MFEQRRKAAVSALMFAVGVSLLFASTHSPYSELVGFLGVSAVTFAGGTARPLYDRFQARRRAEEARRTTLSSIDQQRLRIGDVEVPSISAEYLCDGHQSLDRLIALDFPRGLSDSRPPSDVLDSLRERLLPRLKDEADQRHVGLYDDPAVDLVGVVPIGERFEDGAPILQLRFAETSYFSFALTSNSLDRDLTSLVPELDSRTLREHWKQHEVRRIQDLAELPAPAKVGVGSAVITSDGLLVLLERGQVFQAPSRDGRMLHGVAEGMIPTDLRDDRISPMQTAYRGLREELSVGQDDVDRMHLTGLFLDHQRWQPVFTTAAHLQLDASQLRDRIRHAAHRHETRELVGLAFDPADPELTAILLGTHATFQLASNHAQAVVLAALTAEWGIATVATCLRRTKL